MQHPVQYITCRGARAHGLLRACLEQAGPTGASVPTMTQATGMSDSQVRWNLKRMPGVIMAKTRSFRGMWWFLEEHAAACAAHTARWEAAFAGDKVSPNRPCAQQCKQLVVQAGQAGANAFELAEALGLAVNSVHAALRALRLAGEVVHGADPLRSSNSQALRYYGPGITPVPVPTAARLLRKPGSTAKPAGTKAAPAPTGLQGDAIITARTKITRGADFVDRRHRVDPSDVQPVFSRLKPGQYLPGDSWAAQVYGQTTAAGLAASQRSAGAGRSELDAHERQQHAARHRWGADAGG